MATFYNAMLYGGLALAVIFAIIAVILFVKLNIPKVIGNLTGSTAKKQIQEIREKGYESVQGAGVSKKDAIKSASNTGRISARDIKSSTKKTAEAGKAKYEQAISTLEKGKAVNSHEEDATDILNEGYEDEATDILNEGYEDEATDILNEGYEDEATDILSDDGEDEATDVLTAEDDEATDVLTAEDYEATDILTADDDEATDILTADDGEATDILTADDDEATDILTADDYEATDILTADDGEATDILTAEDDEATDVLTAGEGMNTNMFDGDYHKPEVKAVKQTSVKKIMNVVVVHTEESI